MKPLKSIWSPAPGGLQIRSPVVELSDSVSPVSSSECINRRNSSYSLDRSLFIIVIIIIPLSLTVSFFLCFAGERGDSGEAGGAVPPHCVQHSDAGLQENPGKSLSNGLEPKHLERFVATAGSQTHTHTQIHTAQRSFLCTDPSSGSFVAEVTEKHNKMEWMLGLLVFNNVGHH